VIDMDGVRAVAREVSNWGRWGPDDERGTVNLLSPSRITEAATLVRRGVSIPLSLPMDENGPWDPRTVAGRFNPIHRMTRYRGDNSRGESWGHFSSSDDMLITGMQSSTQFDSLAHVWYDDLLYNGFPAESAVTAWGARRCGITNLVSGVVGRGVLADLPRHLGLDHLPPSFEAGPDLLDEVLAAVGITPRSGDVLLVRTGTYAATRRGVDVGPGGTPGLTWECARWAKRHDLASICADNTTVEVTGTNGDGPMLPLHMLGIRDMGLLLGELFDLEALADDCASDGRYEVLFVGTPLHVPGAVGTPLNPLALK
jgi:hypothetical protein